MSRSTKLVTAASLSLGLFSIGAAGAFAQDVESEKTSRRLLSKSEFGARVGVVDADSLGDPFLGYGVLWNYDLAENVNSTVALDYWSKSSGTLADQGVTVSDTAVSAGAQYHFSDENAKWRPFVGGALALHRFAVRISERDGTDTEVIDEYRERYQDVEGELGTDLGGGVTYNLEGALDVLGEIKYRNVLDDNVELDHLTFNGALAYSL